MFFYDQRSFYFWVFGLIYYLQALVSVNLQKCILLKLFLMGKIYLILLFRSLFRINFGFYDFYLFCSIWFLTTWFWFAWITGFTVFWVLLFPWATLICIETWIKTINLWWETLCDPRMSKRLLRSQPFFWLPY